MQPGDIVRIRPSDRLVGPWKEYAERGAQMRVRGVDRRRTRGAVDVTPVEAAERTLHHHWFDETDLVPLSRDVEMVAAVIRRLRGG